MNELSPTEQRYIQRRVDQKLRKHYENLKAYSRYEYSQIYFPENSENQDWKITKQKIVLYETIVDVLKEIREKLSRSRLESLIDTMKSYPLLVEALETVENDHKS